MVAEFACRGLELKQQWTHLEALIRASHTHLDQEGSFWLDADDCFELLQIWGFRRDYEKDRVCPTWMPVGRLTIMIRKI